MLQYDLVDDYMARRPPFRDQHLTLAREAYERGELLLAGAFADPPDGAALVFKVDDVAIVEQFAANDPYVKAGLVKAWRARQWTVVVGADHG